MARGNRELQDLIKDLGKLEPDLRKELRVEIAAAARKPLAAAKAKASWSSRIPAATRLFVSFDKKKPGARLVVNRKKAPNARPLENRGRDGTIRHPVFGNRRVWVSQLARPFLWPAAKPWLESTDKDVTAAVDRVARRLGFREGG